jgi:ribose transport system substrate-binding protein
VIHSTVVQQPNEFGYQSMKGLAPRHGGDRNWIPATSRLIVETRVIVRHQCRRVPDPTCASLLAGR